MGKKKIVILLSGLIFWSMLGLTPAQSTSPDPANVLIAKSYDGLTPVASAQACQSEFSLNENTYKTAGLIYLCSVTYQGEIKEGTDLLPAGKIEVFSYANPGLAEDELLSELLGAYGKDFISKAQQAFDQGVFKLEKENGRHRGVVFASNNFLIKMTFINTDIPSPMIADYTKKYPPSSLDAGKLSLARALRAGVNIKLLSWRELDSRRKGTENAPDKQQALMSMLQQCKIEMDIRCQLGMSVKNGPVGCPITLIQVDAERERAWLNLSSESEDRDIALESIDWKNHHQGKCPSEDPAYETSIMKILKISAESPN